jgi:imidazolonepropionase-like amidohydrolase
MKTTLGRVVGVALVLAGCGHQTLVTRAPGARRSVVVRNVRVFDAPNARLLDGLRDVVVHHGVIAAVAAPGVAAAGVAEVDGRGGTLLPGLVDVHTHTRSRPEEVSGGEVHTFATDLLEAGTCT